MRSSISRTAWRRFEAWLDRHEKLRRRDRTAADPDALPDAEVPRAYRHVCQHLALARDREYSPDLVDRLNRLALRGHHLLYGARSPDDLLYDHELLAWQREHRHCKVHVTVDRVSPRGQGWTGHVGVVTTLMRRKRLPSHAAYLICGPETMMRFVLRELARCEVPDDHVWVSLERNMKCAVGFCGHCQLGPLFVCQDGPVFRSDRVRPFLHLREV